MEAETEVETEVLVHDSAAALADAAASQIASLISPATDRFTFGLAGGSTPAATYERLREADIGWSAVDVWLSDERWVAPDDERCNGRMARETLIDHVNGRFHRPIWSEFVEPDDAAAHYEAEIRSILDGNRPDLILLGMGDDGHTASLFPGTKALSEESRWFVANYVPQQDEVRLTATFPLLWRARQVIFLVAGEKKAEAVRDSLAGKTPAGRVGEGNGKVTWHLDTAAASLLS
jgi:6-phosphogluconolactonase